MHIPARQLRGNGHAPGAPSVNAHQPCTPAPLLCMLTLPGCLISRLPMLRTNAWRLSSEPPTTDQDCTATALAIADGHPRCTEPSPLHTVSLLSTALHHFGTRLLSAALSLCCFRLYNSMLTLVMSFWQWHGAPLQTTMAPPWRHAGCPTATPKRPQSNGRARKRLQATDRYVHHQAQFWIAPRQCLQDLEFPEYTKFRGRRHAPSSSVCHAE